jgi:hypothetical protein
MTDGPRDTNSSCRSALSERLQTLIRQLQGIALSYRREAALWPKTERAQQVARMLESHAKDLDSLAAGAQVAASPHPDLRRILEAIPSALGMLPDPWPNAEAQYEALATELARELGVPTASPHPSHDGGETQETLTRGDGQSGLTAPLPQPPNGGNQ